MNELIERLAVETGIAAEDGFAILAQDANIEAFAKAVARECVNTIVEDEYTSYSVYKIEQKFNI